MKLRIQGNSIRLRLTRSEVASFHEAGEISCTTQITPEVRFAYQLRTDQAAQYPYAEFQGATLSVCLPTAVAEEWIRADQVSIKHHIQYGGGELSLLVEKDFQCLHREKEDKTDLFVNPNL